MKITHCPICGYGPFEKPYDTVEEIRFFYEICDCCGCEYGNDDNEEYFKKWVQNGAAWFNQKAKPIQWSFEQQLEYRIRPWPPK